MRNIEDLNVFLFVALNQVVYALEFIIWRNSKIKKSFALEMLELK